MRITQNDLTMLSDRINRITKNNPATHSRENGKFTHNIGNYHISYANGGAALHKTTNIHGGVTDLFGYHMPKKDLYERMQAYIHGLSDG